MINTEYSEKFIKDLRTLKSIPIYKKIKKICFIDISKSENIGEIKDLKKISGFKIYYRIKIGDYRIGIKIENNSVFFMRLLHRKDVYKYFP